MSKTEAPPPYTFAQPPSAPPSYAEAVRAALSPGPYAPEQPSATHIITRVVPIGPYSTHLVCPNCQSEIETKTRREPGLIAYVSGFIIALMGCWLGCCLIPCCVDECMQVNHFCPYCQSYLGTYRR